MLEAERVNHLIHSRRRPLSEFHALQVVFVVMVLDINQTHIVPEKVFVIHERLWSFLGEFFKCQQPLLIMLVVLLIWRIARLFLRLRSSYASGGMLGAFNTECIF